MIRKLATAVMAGVFSAIVVGTAFAGAELTSVKGVVLVNAGTGYATATVGAPLKSGDRIMVAGKASSAKLTFSDGCSVPLRAGLLTIGAKSPCAFKAADIPDSAPARAPEPYVEAACSYCLSSLLLAFGGGALVGGGIGYAISNGKTKTVVFISVP